MMSEVMLISRFAALIQAMRSQIPVARVFAGHGFEDGGRTGLDRQMDMVAQGRKGVDRVDDIFGEIARMRGGEAHAPDARDLADGGEQLGEGHLAGWDRGRSSRSARAVESR